MTDYQVIARKYRPRTFDEVVGQEAIARTLENAISSERVAHAYMFCGPRGVGKTSMARILARALNCLEHDAPTTRPCGRCDLCVRAAVGEDLDVLEIDAASNRKVDDARNLIANVSFHPSRARFKVYVVDEVHMLTTEAFNALLKTLEEPPAHVKFIFATTDPQKVPATILSRCQRFDFRPVPPARIAELCGKICEAEGITVDEAALLAIARASVGGVRDAQSLLEQLAALGQGTVKLSDLHELLGTVPAIRMRKLFDAVADGNTAETLGVVGEILDAGTDPGELLRQCMRHARDLTLLKVQGPRGADVVADQETLEALSVQAGRFSEATLVYSITLFGESLKSVRLLGEGRLFAETALARLAGHRDMRYLDQLSRDLRALERRLDDAGAAPRADSHAPPSNPPSGPPSGDAPVGGIGYPASGSTGGGGSTGGAESGGVAPTGSLASRWGDVLEEVRGSSRLRSALQAARVEQVDDTAVVLSFPAGQSYHRKTVADPELAERLARAVVAVAGRPLRVRTIEREPLPEAEAPQRAAPPPDMMRDRLSSAEVEAVRRAPITKLIETELGGRIVHMERE